MLAVHLACPQCSRHLRSNRLIATGEALRCPSCGARFRAGIDGGATVTAASTQRTKGSGVILAWLLFAIVLLLAFGGIELAILLANRSSPQAEVVIAQMPTGKTPVPPRQTSVTPIPPPTPPPPPVEAASRRSTPRPDPLPDPPPTHRTPPPLPQPPPPPAKKTPAKAEKPHATPAPAVKEAPQARWLPVGVQRNVNHSIDNGVEFLRRRQHADGSWGNQSGKVGKRFTPGITALTALTLLECGVTAKDPQIQQAAKYLRDHMDDLIVTYSTSLAILFFDRLGDNADAARIRTLALRLIAGQTTSGGWDYYCPTLNGDEELGLLALLYKERPTTSKDLFATESIELPKLDFQQEEPAPKLEGDLYRPKPSKVPPLDLFVAGKGPAPSADTDGADKPQTETPVPQAKKELAPPPTSKTADKLRLTKKALQAAEHLSEALQKTPALRSAELMEQPPDFDEMRSDNSNTQFAILGLLAAENHDVPMERVSALLDWRFRNSLMMPLGWNYQANRAKWPTTPAMSAVGLMGLALKHGLLLPNAHDRGRNVLVRDPLIHHGFFALDAQLQSYLTGFHFNRVPLDKLDLYCLWTIERVAVLYNLRALGTLDWYPTGVELLLPLQRDDGSWSTAGTTCLREASVSTSFALLFLKRSNLARDLTRRLNVGDDE